MQYDFENTLFEMKFVGTLGTTECACPEVRTSFDRESACDRERGRKRKREIEIEREREKKRKTVQRMSLCACARCRCFARALSLPATRRRALPATARATPANTALDF